MNIVLDHSQFSINNVCFLEKRKNIIVDGTFTKIVYSEDTMCMNGIYLYFPFFTSSAETTGVNRYTGTYSPHSDKYRNAASSSSSSYSRVASKQNVEIDMNISHNASFMSAISNIETDILSYFKMMTGVNKNINYSLRNQMMTGAFNVFSGGVKSSEEAYMDIIVKKRTGALFDGIAINGYSEKRCGGALLSGHSSGATKTDAQDCSDNDRYVLKISGIWETATAVGLTYKFIRARRFSRMPVSTLSSSPSIKKIAS